MILTTIPCELSCPGVFIKHDHTANPLPRPLSRLLIGVRTCVFSSAVDPGSSSLNAERQRCQECHRCVSQHPPSRPQLLQGMDMEMSCSICAGWPDGGWGQGRSVDLSLPALATWVHPVREPMTALCTHRMSGFMRSRGLSCIVSD